MAPTLWAAGFPRSVEPTERGGGFVVALRVGRPAAVVHLGAVAPPRASSTSRHSLSSLVAHRGRRPMVLPDWRASRAWAGIDLAGGTAFVTERKRSPFLKCVRLSNKR
jgi:hypothetical protein